MQHENITRQDDPEIGSDRGFAVVFTIVFLLIGCWPVASGGALRLWALAVAALIGGIGLLRPAVLHVPNVLWARFGLLLGHIVAPLALGLLFFGVVTPLGWLMRGLGKRPLTLSPQADVQSYWRKREDRPLTPETFRNQF
jgi:hypothetical protein